MKNSVQADVAIIGGGIAGLWLLNRLRKLGYSAILLECNTLGGGQTHKSQGIIHGGMKYALQGIITSATETVSDMPTIWRDCLAGKGEIDLTGVPILSKEHYLWSTDSLTSKLTGFFVELAMKGSITTLPRTDYPEVFQSPQFKGNVYALNEIVIDTHALILELVKPNQDAIFKIDALEEDQLQFDENGRLTSFEIRTAPLEPIKVKAQKYIFTAGAGNEFLANKLKTKCVAMQRRPLHMVIMKSEFPYAVFAHCLGFSSVPRVTITTHKAHDGKTIWYIGGGIAEEGIKKDTFTQANIAKKELQDLFPWLNFSKAEFASFMVDRAEPLQSDGKRPDSCFMQSVENIIVGWPTKLALAPKLANEIIATLQQEHIEPKSQDIHLLRGWPIPALAKPIWDQLL